MAEITIIVPVYGVETWLRQCVESILSQTFRDFRLILVDDGSPDGCPGICDAFARADARVRVIHQGNRGVSAARNAGLALAEGSYVTFCDGDDFWEPSHLENLWKGARDTGADLVSCNYRVVSESGAFCRTSAYPAGITELPGKDYILNKVLRGQTGWEVWSRLYDLARIREANLRFCEDCGYGEDLAFTLSYLLRCCRVCALEKATCCYRQRAGSAMDRGKAVSRIPDLTAAARSLEDNWGEDLPRATLAILREELTKHPAEALPGLLKENPGESWLAGQFRRAAADQRLDWESKVLCRFCLHRNPWRYRLERRVMKWLQLC